MVGVGVMQPEIRTDCRAYWADDDHFNIEYVAKWEKKPWWWYAEGTQTVHITRPKYEYVNLQAGKNPWGKAPQKVFVPPKSLCASFPYVTNQQVQASSASERFSANRDLSFVPLTNVTNSGRMQLPEGQYVIFTPNCLPGYYKYEPEQSPRHYSQRRITWCMIYGTNVPIREITVLATTFKRPIPTYIYLLALTPVSLAADIISLPFTMVFMSTSQTSRYNNYSK
jgi:hypothetical protein